MLLLTRRKSFIVFFGFWWFWITWRLCNPCFRERKGKSAFFDTQHRQEILNRNWDVVCQSMTEKKSRISSQSGRYIYFKVSFLSTNLKTLSKKIALITSHLSFILRFYWIVVLWFRNFTWLWAWRHQVTCTGIPKHAS